MNKIQRCGQDGAVIGGMLSILKQSSSEPPIDAFVKSLSEQSETFRQVWEKMQASVENTKHHQGETSASHTISVMNALERIWAKELPEAKASLGRLVGVLHDVGKPSAREEKETAPGEKSVTFHKHAPMGADIAKGILKEIGEEQAELVEKIVRLHMILFQGLNYLSSDPNSQLDNEIKGLATNEELWDKMGGTYELVKYLVAMTRADLESINSPQLKDLDALVSRLDLARKDVEASRLRKKEEDERAAKMTPEQFVTELRGKGTPDKAIQRALQGKYKLTDEQAKAYMAKP